MAADKSSQGPVGILSLDAGGPLGVSSLIILRQIMDQLSCALGRCIVPCEMFDLICGTGTGGLLAIMLGRLRMSIYDATNEYLALNTTLFTRKYSRAWGGSRQAVPVYDHIALETMVKDISLRYGNCGDSIKPITYADRLENKGARCLSSQ